MGILDIKRGAFGSCMTNCFVVTLQNTAKNSPSDTLEVIIDPGDGAHDFVLDNVKNPAAILLTHGHFDHIFDVAKLKASFEARGLKVPIVMPSNDAFMSVDDIFDIGVVPFTPDFLVEEAMDKRLHERLDMAAICGKAADEIATTPIIYHYYPGHTPGCSAIEIDGHLFSGDFIFERAFGRVDFPYSSREDMLASLDRFLSLQEDMVVHPGHGRDTTVRAEQGNVKFYKRAL